MSLKKTLLAGAAIAAFAVSPAFAQLATQIDDLDVDRIGPAEVEIDFEFDGSACLTVGAAEVGEIVDGVLTVTFPTSESAEVCTQQIVDVEVRQTVAADETVTWVEVVLLGPDGSVAATDREDVDLD